MKQKEILFFDKNTIKHKHGDDGTYFISYKCPLCEKVGMGAIWLSLPQKDCYGETMINGEEGLLETYKVVMRGYLTHIRWKILFDGSTSHMKLFVKIFGKKTAIKKFEVWRKRCDFASKNLTRYLRELEGIK